MKRSINTSCSLGQRLIIIYFLMLDEKRIQESKKRIEQSLKNREIIKEAKVKYAEFFVTNSRNSFDVAKLLYDVSTIVSLKKSMGLPHFNGFPLGY